MNKLKKSITVEFWSRIFLALSFLSFFKWICYCPCLKSKMKTDKSYQIVDKWVLFNFFFAFSSIFLIRYVNSCVLNWLLVGYGFLRVFEVVVYQVNVLLFDEYRAKKKKKQQKIQAYRINELLFDKPRTKKKEEKYKIRGYRRMVVNLLTNFVEIAFWFAASYCCFFIQHLYHGHIPSLAQILYTSFSFTTGFGILDLISLKKASDFGAIILYFQSMAGLIMTLISLSRFISLLPQTPSMDEYEN